MIYKAGTLHPFDPRHRHQTTLVQADISPSFRWHPGFSSLPTVQWQGLHPRWKKDMHTELRRAYDSEMTAAVSRYDAGDLRLAFSHLERAHILGQSFPIAHARTHWWMLKVGWKRQDVVEILGQIPRIVGALLFSRLWVPLGNTGGARVSAFQPMPIPEDLQRLLDKYGRGSRV